MYPPRVRHNLDESTVKLESSSHIFYHLLERRDKCLDKIEWSGIHELVRRPDRTNGLGRKECQELRFSILDNLMKNPAQHPGK